MFDYRIKPWERVQFLEKIVLFEAEVMNED